MQTPKQTQLSMPSERLVLGGVKGQQTDESNLQDKFNINIQNMENFTITTPRNNSFTKMTEDKPKNLIDRSKTLKFQEMVSAMSDDNYFKEDIKERKKQQFIDAQTDKNKTKNFFEQFHFSYFLEFLLFHLLYFLFLGPLSYLIINLRGKALSKNMSFIGNSRSTYTQFALYLLNIITLALYFTNDNKVITFQVEIINIIGITVSRCFIIACKYGTYDSLKIKVLRTTVLTSEQKNADLFLFGWITQSPEVIHYQVYQCQRAFDIDPSLFFIQFMVDPEQKTHDRLMDHDKILLKVRSTDEYCEIKPIPILKNKKGDKFYFGYAILKDLIDSYQEENKSFKRILMSFVFSYGIIRALIPLAVRIYNNPTSPYPSGTEYFIALLSLTQVASMFIIVATQSAFGYIDIKRKLSFMIAPRKLKNLDMKKQLPTINIFDSGTLKGWTLIRKVCMEYGKGFSLRVQGLFTFLGFWSIGSIILLFLHNLKYVSFLQETVIYQLYSDITVTLILIFSLMIAGAQINDVFDLQESILNSNKTIISDLNLVVQGLLNDQYHSQSYIYTKALERILEQNPNEPLEQIENILNHYNFHISELLYDKKHNPFTLFGLKVTFLMLQSAVIAIGSLCATIISQFKSG